MKTLLRWVTRRPRRLYMRLQFKDGTVVDYPVDEFTADRGSGGRAIGTLQWKTPPGATTILKDLDLDAVAAVYAVYR